MASGRTTRRCTLALAVAALLGGCGEDAPKRDAAGAIEQAGESSLLALRTGDCTANLRDRLEHPDGGHNGVPRVKAVNCSTEHDAEVVLITPLEGDEWPGFSIIEGDAARGQDQLQPRLLRAERAGGEITLVSFRPTKERWDFEDQRDIVFLALFDRRQRVPAPR